MKKQLSLTFSLWVRVVVMISVPWRMNLGCQAWNANASIVRSTFWGSSRFRVDSSSPTRSFVRASGLYMMPEGPEVRTLVDQLHPSAIGHRLVDLQFLSGRYVRHGRPRGFHEFAATMTPWSKQQGTSPQKEPATTVDMIQEWKAKGKFIYIILDKGLNPPASSEKKEGGGGGGYQRSIWITLGMSGRFVSETAHLQDPRFARWVLEVLDPTTGALRKIFYHDARNFGTLRFCLSSEELQEKLESLGLDILEPDSTTEDTFLELVDRQRPELNVCKFLMDQSVSISNRSFGFVLCRKVDKSSSQCSFFFF